MNFDSVSILIVNYNVKEYLGNCIDSILQSEYKGAIEIVVVDNHSFDGSDEFIHNRFPDIKMIKKIVILITAFTIGHTLTLILSTLNLIQYDQKIIEFAIPLTIAITAINNIRKRNQTLLGGGNLNYYLALFF